MKNNYLKISLLLIANLMLGIAYSQVNSQIQWRKNMGGSYSEFPGEIVNTYDGGYIYCGTTDSDDNDVHGLHGSNYDVWVVKINALGDTAWTKTYGGTEADWGKSIIQTPDSGYAFVADIRSDDEDVDTNYGGWDMWVVKLDKLGAIQWQKTYGGSSYEEANGIIRCNDGTYIIGGYSDSNDGYLTNNNGSYDFWAFKLDANGNLIWQKNYGGNGSDEMYSLSGKDQYVYLAGTTWSDDTTDGDVTQHEIGYYDYWVLKIDTAGNKIWNKRMGSTDEDVVYSCVYTSDKGVILGGKVGLDDGDVDTTYSPYYFDGWIVKLDSAGNMQWKNSYGGDSSDVVKSIIQTKEGGYFVGGYTYSSAGMVGINRGEQDVWALKLKPNGDLEWYDTFGGSSWDGNYYWARQALDVVEAVDGGYLIITSTESNNSFDVGASKGAEDMWLVKLKCAPAFSAEICMVTYDSASGKNMVIWEDAGYPGYIESVNVYRETAITGVYALIGNVLVDSLSQYIDTSSAINPLAQICKYKIAAVDSCGSISDTSAYHKTVVLTASPSGTNNINLIWNDYEGFVASSYKIYRYTNSAPTPTLVISLAAGSSPFVDVNAPQNDTAKYFIKIVPPTACTTSKNYNEGRSNTAANTIATIGIEEGVAINQVYVSPNPSNGVFNVSVAAGVKNENVIVEVLAITGQQVYSSSSVSSSQSLINFAVDMKDAPKGVYFLNVKTEAEIVTKRLIIQ